MICVVFNEQVEALALFDYVLCPAFHACSPEEVQTIVSGKLALKYTGPDVEAMKAIATASHNRSLADFQKATAKYKVRLVSHAFPSGLVSQNILIFTITKKQI